MPITRALVRTSTRRSPTRIIGYGARDALSALGDCVVGPLGPPSLVDSGCASHPVGFACVSYSLLGGLPASSRSLTVGGYRGCRTEGFRRAEIHAAPIALPVASTSRAPRRSSSTPIAAPARATAVIHAIRIADGCCNTGANAGT